VAYLLGHAVGLHVGLHNNCWHALRRFRLAAISRLVSGCVNRIADLQWTQIVNATLLFQNSLLVTQSVGHAHTVTWHIWHGLPPRATPAQHKYWRQHSHAVTHHSKHLMSIIIDQKIRQRKPNMLHT